jgi:heptose I phosphotransferase
MTDYFVRQDLQPEVSKLGLLPWAQEVAAAADQGDIYRSKEGRKTLRFERGGQSYFLKLHNGIGWGEIFKNLLQGRLPVLGAVNEYRAVEALSRIGVDTMSIAAYTSCGRNPAAIQSLIVTDDLIGTVSLEDYCADWANSPPDVATRLKLLRKLADSARLMHGAGINHRDFYICHFHLDENSLALGPVRCHLIDLHRAQIRRTTPRRWRVKDLAGLYFSAMDCGLRQRDLLRFMHHYCDGGLREALRSDGVLWQDVAQVATRLYIKQHGRSPPGMKAEGVRV